MEPLTIWDITDLSTFGERIEVGFELVARADPSAEDIEEEAMEREVVSIGDSFQPLT